MAGATLVVGTAGHIDHGKTSLVRLLTGVDLDTAPEERSRGITIALGFVPMDLPDGRRLAFVDVPGHERLVRTMIAGATGIDAAMLCVSAQDGVMPQTREHLAILELLGLQAGLIALTKADLVDEELLELALMDVEEAVAGTFLEGAPVVPVSSVTGAGKEALTAALAGLSRVTRHGEGPFRLPVDRAFTRPGFGTVATGTAWSGELADGATVTLLPAGRTARVRSLQTHGQPATAVRAGWRVAVNLSGVDVDDVPRGTVLTTGDVPVTSMIDVLLSVLPGAPELADGASVRFLLGTSEQVGNVHLAADLDALEPGTTVPAQVRLDAPIAALPGDRFVLRRTSPVQTVGGGVVVDPWAPRLRRKRRVEHGEGTKRLHGGDRAVLLERAGDAGIVEAEWAGRGAGQDLGVVLGGRRLADGAVARLEAALVEAVEVFHRENALQRGAGRRELLRGRLGHLNERVFDDLVRRLADGGALDVDGSLVRRAGFEVALDTASAKVRTALLSAFLEAGLEGLTAKKVHEAFPDKVVGDLLRLAEVDGSLVPVPSVGWLHGTVVDDLRGRLRGWFADHDQLDPIAFKELTGQPRRVAIPLLEWLDKQGWTRRAGEGRVRGAWL